ncbi:PspA/IM30 family protein [Rhodococcus sp. ACT016]|uniref:PspA/IM30 family protein n=1 Tax=Rhodococcus sp. ACT016 TaxID=3134808 RepID=UPI003D274F05
MVDMDSGGSDAALERLRSLGDAELLAAVLAVTAGRPALAPVHAAASMLSAGGGQTSDIPPDPSRPSVPPEVPPPLTLGTASTPAPDYTDAGVPTFDRVRDKIEERFGTALGSEELERDSQAGRDLDEQWQAREKAAHDKLDEIRRSMKNE